MSGELGNVELAAIVGRRAGATTIDHVRRFARPSPEGKRSSKNFAGVVPR
jgi:hypothetical protein